MAVSLSSSGWTRFAQIKQIRRLPHSLALRWLRANQSVEVTQRKRSPALRENRTTSRSQDHCGGGKALQRTVSTKTLAFSTSLLLSASKTKSTSYKCASKKFGSHLRQKAAVAANAEEPDSTNGTTSKKNKK
mmetsp:Transcript_11571/g.16719  ORF Transcript_11571/g.16719 Transcript_11571/m.16719 type:complete len:132 (-) Transcript_11571:645-1040(-)